MSRDVFLGVLCSVVDHLFGSQPLLRIQVSRGRGRCYARAAKSRELDRELPTAPPPPCTSTCSPACSPARSNNPCHAVNAPIGTDAASTWVRRVVLSDAARLRDAILCHGVLGEPVVHAVYFWPISKPAVSPPTAAMTPENSCPGFARLRFSPSFLCVVGYHNTSIGVTPAHRHGPAVRLAEVAAEERFPQSTNTRALARNQISALFSFFASVYCCDFRGQCPDATGFRQSLLVRCGSHWFSHCKRRGLKLNVFFAFP